MLLKLPVRFALALSLVKFFAFSKTSPMDGVVTVIEEIFLFHKDLKVNA